MIKLHPRPPAPPYLNGETVTNKKQELAERFAAGERLEFPSYWLNDDVREPLWNLHRGKCCYCERKREIKRESDIEHYRPKSTITDEDGHPGYWWLAYEWSNYLFSCKPCNQTHKKNHFPLLPDSLRAAGPEDDFSVERPVILNPIDDNPEDCISYDWWSGGGIYVKALGTDEERRGLETICILGLNNQHLMEERSELLTLLSNLANIMIVMRQVDNASEIERLAADIHGQTSAKKTFAGFRRAFFKARSLEEYVAND